MLNSMELNIASVIMFMKAAKVVWDVLPLMFKIECLSWLPPI